MKDDTNFLMKIKNVEDVFVYIFYTILIFVWKH